MNVGAEVYYPSGKGDSLLAAKNLLKIVPRPGRYKELPKAVWDVARDPLKVVKAARRYYILKQPASIGSSNPHLSVNCEQEPNNASRITLSEEKDSLGMPRVMLDWRLTGLETKSVEVFLNAVSSEWRRMGIGEVDFSKFHLKGREIGLHGGYIDSAHHIGTTRMGTDPRQSVVGPDCRVHGYDNLYIGSSSVFPTGGFSNPTLTIIALCLRIADSIKELLARAP